MIIVFFSPPTKKLDFIAKLQPLQSFYWEYKLLSLVTDNNSSFSNCMIKQSSALKMEENQSEFKLQLILFMFPSQQMIIGKAQTHFSLSSILSMAWHNS